jgi:hypothetical protein
MSAHRPNPRDTSTTAWEPDYHEDNTEIIGFIDQTGVVSTTVIHHADNADAWLEAVVPYSTDRRDYR